MLNGAVKMAVVADYDRNLKEVVYSRDADSWVFILTL